MTRILDVCFFSSAKDNRPASHPMDVDALEAAFRDAVKSGLVEVRPTEDAKKAGPAFSPCRYPPRTTRAKDSVEVVTAFVMDLDNVDDAFVDEVFASLASVGVRAFGWSTWGSGWKKLPQSWRVVVPFAVDVNAADWPAVWLALSARLALGRNDGSTKNADRLHFVPNAPFMVPDGKGGERLNEPIRWRSLQGALFDPSSVVEESRLKLLPKPTSGSRIVDVYQAPSLDLGTDPLGLDFGPVPRMKPKVDEEKIDVKALAEDLRKRQPADCSALADSLGLHGKSRRWLCPSSSCKGKTEATLSTPEAGGWTCFRCGAKGDAIALVGIAQGHTLPLRGRDFVDVLTWLGAHIGVTGTVTATVTVDARPTIEPATIAAEWGALESRQTADSAAARWLLGRGISAQLVRSGFAVLDGATVGALRDAPAIGWLRYNVGAAIVAPLRSLRTGGVCALQGRVFKVSDPKFKRAVVGQLRDGDKTPRVFGDVKHLRSARVVVLVEGLADTWAGEVLTAGVDGVVVVGASSAEAMPDVAAWLAENTSAHIVVVRHLDNPDAVEADKQGVGQKKAREAEEVIGRRGSRFHWPNFRRALLAIGVDTRGPVPPGFDLAAALALCAGVDTIAIQSAFRGVLPKQPLPRLDVSSSASHRRVTAPPAPPPAPVAVIIHNDDVVEGRRIAGAELGIDVDHLFATIDRLWRKQA